MSRNKESPFIIALNCIEKNILNILNSESTGEEKASKLAKILKQDKIQEEIQSLNTPQKIAHFLAEKHIITLVPSSDNKPDSYGNTPLMLAIRGNYVNVVKAILEKSLPLEVISVTCLRYVTVQLSALDIALDDKYYNKEIIESLIAYYISYNLINDEILKKLSNNPHFSDFKNMLGEYDIIVKEESSLLDEIAQTNKEEDFKEEHIDTIIEKRVSNIFMLDEHNSGNEEDLSFITAATTTTPTVKEPIKEEIGEFKEQTSAKASEQSSISSLTSDKNISLIAQMLEVVKQGNFNKAISLLNQYKAKGDAAENIAHNGKLVRELSEVLQYVQNNNLGEMNNKCSTELRSLFIHYLLDFGVKTSTEESAEIIT